MISKESYEKGLRCKGICSVCKEKYSCYQAIAGGHGKKILVTEFAFATRGILEDVRTNEELERVTTILRNCLEDSIQIRKEEIN